MPWPTLAIKIATSAPLEAFTLDDATEGRLADPPTIVGYPLGGTFGKEWTEITTDVLHESGVEIIRGSSSQQGPYFRTEAGRCTFTLDNRSGDYDPLNLTSPYVAGGVSQLLPGVPVNIEATYEGAVFSLFVGYVEKWDVTYPGEANTTSIVEVSAVDSVALLQAANKPEVEAIGAGDYTYQRIGRLLDRADWPAAQRDLGTNTETSCLATTMTESPWAELLTTADSANGYLFVTVDGVVTYRSRGSFPRTPEIVIGAGTDLPVVSLQLSNDWDQIYNRISLAKNEGVQQSVFDESSVSLFGTRTFERSDLICLTDDQVADSAALLLSQYGNQVLRLDGIELQPDDTYSGAAWGNLLRMEFLRHIEAAFQSTDGRDITAAGLVRGIKLSARPLRWVWQLSTTRTPDTAGDFTLDDDSLGLLAGYLDSEIELITGYYEFLVAQYGQATADSLFTTYGLNDFYGDWSTYWATLGRLPADLQPQLTKMLDFVGLSFTTWTALYVTQVFRNLALF
jgi:hypothetical protein